MPYGAYKEPGMKKYTPEALIKLWLPIFLGALGVGTAALLFKRTMSSSDIDARQNNKGEQNGTV